MSFCNKYSALPKIWALMCIAMALVAASPARAEMETEVVANSIYDDNLYLLDANSTYLGSKVDPVDSWIYVLHPSFKLKTEDGNIRYHASLDAEHGTYSNSWHGNDDYTDYGANGGLDAALDVSNRLSFDAGVKEGHDFRGTARTDIAGKAALLFLQPAPDEWEMRTAQLNYDLGAPDAPARLVASYRYTDKNYTNNTPATTQLNHNDNEVRLIGYVKVMPRTSLLFEARDKETNYDILDPVTKVSHDSQELQYFVGAEWDATAKTTGAVRVGYQEKNPDVITATQKDFSSSAWEADVVWQPRSYSSVRFMMDRGVFDAVNAVAYVDSKTYSVSWHFDWTSRIATELLAYERDENYTGFSRDDRTTGFGGTASYRAMPWLKLLVQYDYSQRSSSVVGLNYDDNRITLGVDADIR